MQEPQAVSALSALAHQHRLRIFRLLVIAGPSGVPAGAIAEQVGISPTSTSFHLKELDRAGLIKASRDGRFIRYAVHVEGMRQLLAYLTEDCCQGQPELCGSGIAASRALCTSKGGSK
jgi:ArsR family transcriptional regulator, arsenate/arsenite/antimonite-responsive transcriptional repressor